MAPLPPVADVIKADLDWTFGSDQNVHSHLYFHYTSAPPNASLLQTFSNAVGTSWDTDMKAYQATTCILETVTCTDLGNPSTQSGQTTFGVAGTKPSADLPADVCVLVNLHIGRRYRGGHPRLYLPIGGAADIATPQSWTSSQLGAWLTSFSAFVNSLLNIASPGPTCDSLANVSYRSGGAARPVPVTDPVLNWTINPIPGSQRRRLGR